MTELAQLSYEYVPYHIIREAEVAAFSAIVVQLLIKRKTEFKPEGVKIEDSFVSEWYEPILGGLIFLFGLLFTHIGGLFISYVQGNIVQFSDYGALYLLSWINVRLWREKSGVEIIPESISGKIVLIALFIIIFYPEIVDIWY